MSFNNLALASNILKAIAACGYAQPTPIQEKGIPLILAGKDLIAAAGTGTGKTAAFMLPALHYLSVNKTHAKTTKPRILVLTPTRELADQITKAARDYGRYLQFRISSIIGGVSYRKQSSSLYPVPDIIIATPGRLMDYLDTKQIDLSDISMLILDEADRMLDMGFSEDVNAIIRKTPRTRQTLLFSATYNNRIASLARDILKNPEQLHIAKEPNQKVNIEQQIYMVQDSHHKTNLLSELLIKENIFKAIIFTGMKVSAAKLSKQLCEQGYQAAELHGDLRQNQRNAVIDKFRKDRIQYLVATDVAARGIDVTGITHVINFDFPKFAEDYIHRIGRTGRAGKSGIAISMVLPKEMRHIKQVERYTKQKLLIIGDKAFAAASAAPRQTNSRKPVSYKYRNQAGKNYGRTRREESAVY